MKALPVNPMFLNSMRRVFHEAGAEGARYPLNLSLTPVKQQLPLAFFDLVDHAPDRWRHPDCPFALICRDDLEHPPGLDLERTVIGLTGVLRMHVKLHPGSLL